MTRRRCWRRKRTQGPLSPKRRVVERTFSWLGQDRRINKDYERLAGDGKAFIYAAIRRLMVKRLARSQTFPDGFTKMVG